jgi:PPK2 family polyphosphate:nucleotide phosphotransferase
VLDSEAPEEAPVGQNDRVARFVKPFRVENGRRFRLKDYDPGDTRGIDSKEKAEKYLARGIDRLAELQEKLYAQDRWAVLLVFQAMDAAGKDGAIKHVMSGVNPQGCQVFSFKAPTSDDLDHDYLWRTARCLPERGRIGIFNRSYYEEVLVVRVHPEILSKQKLPTQLVTKRIWRERHEDIAAHERYLARNGVAVVKFFLHLSKAEQKRRFLERLDRPEKNWKFSSADAKERRHWKEYMRAYEEMIQATAAPHAPWYVVPADKKWFSRIVVAGAIIDAMEKLGLAFPRVDEAQKRELAAARVELAGEKGRDRRTLVKARPAPATTTKVPVAKIASRKVRAKARPSRPSRPVHPRPTRVPLPPAVEAPAAPIVIDLPAEKTEP